MSPFCYSGDLSAFVFSFITYWGVFKRIEVTKAFLRKDAAILTGKISAKLSIRTISYAIAFISKGDLLGFF